jgi:deazaflavin-dependent oxidoreductase (nitroreductase family)
MLLKRMRPINKRFINPITRGLARLPFGPFAVIRHIGRHSGKRYETTIMVEPMGDRFVIALTYGADVDWYRNVRATGSASLLWHGRLYKLDQLESLDSQEALRVYPPIQKLILKSIGTHEFVRMRYLKEIDH